MRKFYIAHAKTLNQAGGLAFESTGAILLSVFLFLTGISTGIFLELTMAADEKSNLASYLQQFLSTDSTVDYPNPFTASLTNNLFLLFVIFLAGLSVLGVPVALAALLYKGVALGFSCGLIMESLSTRGITVILTALVPQNLLLIPVFLLATAAAFNYARIALASRKVPIKKSLRETSSYYILLILFMAFIVVIACAIETVLYPIVL